MGKLFGTDGIRGVSGQYPITVEMAERIGRASAKFFGTKPGASMVVGRDPRISGARLLSWLIKGCEAGDIQVFNAGILPTPAVAHLTKALGACAGIVISASHNPFEDNGFKFFDGHGLKLSEAVETELEHVILDISKDSGELPKGEKSGGNGHPIADAAARYTAFLTNVWPASMDLRGIHMVVDGANGATAKIAPSLFEGLGARVTPIFCDPDGRNINCGCGSEHTEGVSERVVTLGADVGFAFDGDGDRLVAVDETGRRLSGDHILAIIAKDMKDRGILQHDTVVSTVMSNVGLTSALKKMGISHVKAGVGDRLVMEKMKETGAILGGEDSGHMIFLDRHTTGDGMLSALMLLETMRRSGRSLSDLARIMVPMPQTLINVKVRTKPPLSQLDSVMAEIRSVENLLGDEGRVLVRYSGTQAICRVMVEGPTVELTNQYGLQLADAIKRALS